MWNGTRDRPSLELDRESGHLCVFEPIRFVIPVEPKDAFGFVDEPWEMWKLLRNMFSVADNDINGVMNIEVGALLGSMWERQ
jgi:hypothetical protein